MRIRLILSLLTVVVHASWSQSVQFGSQTSVRVGTDAVLYMGGLANVGGDLNNDGVTIVESDADLSGTVVNNGALRIGGDSRLGDGSDNVVFTNNVNANAVIVGNAFINNPVINDGSLLIQGNGRNQLNAEVTNAGQLAIESDVEMTSDATLDNIGSFGVLGTSTVNGNLITYPSSQTFFDGELNQNAPLTNNGLLAMTGTANMVGDFVNANQADFQGETSFSGDVTNQQNAGIFLSADATFTGALDNQGEISVIANEVIDEATYELDFGGNTSIGTINTVDLFDPSDPSSIISTVGEVVILTTADTLLINTLNLNTEGQVKLPESPVFVEESLTVANGVVNATDPETFIVRGATNIEQQAGAKAYIEGTMVGATVDGEKLFPLGLNDTQYFVTLIADQANVPVKVECITPLFETTQLKDSSTFALSEQVEWVIQSLGDSVEVQLLVTFENVDLSTGANIRADDFNVTVQQLDTADGEFHALRFDRRDIEGTNDNLSGRILLSDKIVVGSTPQRLLLGYSPLIKDQTVYIPTAFSPNGGFEENRFFRPFLTGGDVVRIDFSIYDEYNNQVFRSSQTGSATEVIDLADAGWDGIISGGQEAPEGVYYYKVSIDYINTVNESSRLGETIKFNKPGSFLLVR